MLYFLVAFIAFSAFELWNPMLGPQAAFQCSDDSCLSAFPHQGSHYTRTCTAYDCFPDDDSSLGNISHFYYVTAGHKTHNPGCMTHNFGGMTHNASHMTTQ